MPDSALVLFALVILLPLVGAVAAGLTRGRVSDTIAIGATFLAAVAASILVARHGFGTLTIPLGGFAFVDRMLGHPVILFGFTIDPLSSMVLLGAALLGFVCALYSLAYVGPANRESPVTADRSTYWFWLLLFVMAMSGLAISATLFQLLIFWELTTVCSWALIGTYDEEHGALDAARKAFLMTAAGGLALFAAVIVLLAATGSVEFSALGQLPAGARGGLAALLLVLMLVGAWAKSGQVPFHTWLPSAMVAPSPVSAYLHAASMVNAGVYLVLRLVLANGGGAAPQLHLLPGFAPWLIGAMAVVTLVVAIVQFFVQNDLKRLLALSTISHLALVMLAAALALQGSLRAAQGAALHILAHGVGKALLFLSVGTLSYAAGTRRIRDLSGVFTRAPIPALGFLIGMLTVTGVPPFAGFWSKLLMVTGAVSLGGVGVWAGALIVAESVVAFAWFLWVGQRVFLGKPSSAVLGIAPRAPAMEAALVILMVLCLAITLVAMPLAGALHGAAPAVSVHPLPALAPRPGLGG